MGKACGVDTFSWPCILPCVRHGGQFDVGPMRRQRGSGFRDGSDGDSIGIERNEAMRRGESLFSVGVGRAILNGVVLTAILASVCQAETIYVDDGAPLGGDGTMWTTAYKYLQDALANADTNGTEMTPLQQRGAGGSPSRLPTFHFVPPGRRQVQFACRTVLSLTSVPGYSGTGQKT